MAIFWGYIFEGVIPDLYDLIVTIIASVGFSSFSIIRVWRGVKLDLAHPTNYNFVFILSTFGLFAVMLK